MAEIVSCPACQRELQVPAELLGQTVQCPECKQPFEARVAPSSGVTSAAPEPPAREAPAGRPRRWEDDEDDVADVRRSRHELPPNRAAMILTFGILSMVMFGFCIVSLILGPIAWVMGGRDLEAIREGRMSRDGEGMIQAGRILGLVGAILGLLVAAFWCVYVLFFVLIFGMAAANAPQQRRR